MRPIHILFATVVVVAAVAPVSAQSVMPARSGTLHYFDGNVSIDGAEVRMKAGIFPEVRPGSVLRTERGRAEVLLTPGVFLRLGDNSAMRMLDADLSHTRLEIMDGTAMVEADDPQISVKNAPVTIVYRDREIRIVKHGLVEINADSQQVKVFRGEAEVADSSGHVTLREGHYTPLTGELRAEKFDRNLPNDLYVWSRDRSTDLTAANMFSAGSMNTTGTGYGYTGLGTGAGALNGGWYYNSFLNMFTYMPMAGVLWNPWGYGFYSPRAFYAYGGPAGVYNPAYAASVGRALNGFSNSTVTQSAITRSGGANGSVPALGNPVRSGAAGLRAGSATAGAFGGRSAASSGMGMHGGHGGHR